ncbi:MAG: NADH-quinone oxidoreductase subunit NuoK [Nitrospinae bacterium]|nr:NADH-quinone oxidoreductase subunit NuoK [Nitrospinota bacterium]
MSVGHYLLLSAALFAVGVVGVVTRRNSIIVYMCIELMLNAVNLTFIAFARQLGDMGGQIFTFMVMTVAAAEAAVGLAIIISVFRNRLSVDVDDVNLLKG